MKFVSIHDYDKYPKITGVVDEILAGDDHVVMTYVEGFYMAPLVDLVAIATTPTGTLILLEKTGTITTFNTSAPDCRAQRVPIDMFFEGPNDGNELVALWNEYKQRRDQALMREAVARGEA